MKKLLVVPVFSLLALGFDHSSASALEYVRKYGGAWPKSSVVIQGVHTAITTPNTTPKIVNTDGKNLSMSLNWADIQGYMPEGNMWWVQTGVVYGYGVADDPNAFNSTAKVYIEYGTWPGGLQEKIMTTQPFNTTWDYWIRYDPSFSAWKVNINNEYATWVFPYGPKTGKSSLLGEISVTENGNGPARFSGNQFQDLSGNWKPFDGNFELKVDPNSGFIIPSAGTVTSFTVYK